MELAQKIENIIQAPLDSVGFNIVRITFLGSRNKVLQIMLERQDNKTLTVEDCSEASFVISTYLELENPIKSNYNLEISSPGLDRPLVKQKDYIRFCGHEVIIRTLLPICGYKKFQGILSNADDQMVTLEKINGENDHISIPYSDIRSAKLYVDYKSLFKNQTRG